MKILNAQQQPLGGPVNLSTFKLFNLKTFHNEYNN